MGKIVTRQMLSTDHHSGRGMKTFIVWVRSNNLVVKVMKMMGLPWWVSGKESTCNTGDPANPWVGKVPRRRERLPTPVFLPGEFHGQKSLLGYSPWGHKELDMTEETENAVRKIHDGERNVLERHLLAIVLGRKYMKLGISYLLSKKKKKKDSKT